MKNLATNGCTTPTLSCSVSGVVILSFASKSDDANGSSYGTGITRFLILSFASKSDDANGSSYGTSITSTGGR